MERLLDCALRSPPSVAMAPPSPTALEERRKPRDSACGQPGLGREPEVGGMGVALLERCACGQSDPRRCETSRIQIVRRTSLEGSSVFHRYIKCLYLLRHVSEMPREVLT